MKRVTSVLAAAGLALVIGATSAQAQSLSVGVGGGIVQPLGDFKDLAKLGFHGSALVGYSLPSGLGFRGELFYAQNKFKDDVAAVVGDGKTKMAAGIGSVTYSFKTAGSITPYVLGSIGYFNAKVESDLGDDSESKIGFGGGAGLKFPLGSDGGFFVESRYLSVNTSGGSTNFIPVTVGVTFGLGK